METRTVCAEHINEMASAKYPIYKLFQIIPMSPESSPSEAEKDLSEIVEFAIVQELTVKDALFTGATTLFSSGPACIAGSLRLWKSVLKKAFPDRRGMTAALNYLCDWIAKLNDDVRNAILNDAANAAILFEKIDERQADELIACLDGITDMKVFRGIVEDLNSFPPRDRHIATAFIHCTLFYAKQRPGDYRDAVRKPVAANEEMVSDEAFSMLQSLSKLSSDNDAALGDALRARVYDLVFLVSGHSIGSAAAVAKDIVKKIKALPAGMREAYLGWVTMLIQSIGIRTIGFALDTLPAMCRGKSLPEVDAFMQCAESIGLRYGATAGEWFIGSKTKASKKFL